MRHIIVLREEEIRALLTGKKVEIVTHGERPIVIMSEETFKEEEKW